MKKIVFVILFILIIYIVLCYKNNTTGGGHPDVLIIDVANVCSERFNGYAVYDTYLKCITDIQKSFDKNNDAKIEYIIKNHTFRDGNELRADKINDEIWDKLKKFTVSYPSSSIIVAEDYTRPIKNWDKLHYLRERDDHACFIRAQVHKRNYTRAVVMSNDMYKDFNTFGYIPSYTMTIVENGKTKSEKINPRPNLLGQIIDYKLVKNSINFKFEQINLVKKG